MAERDQALKYRDQLRTENTALKARAEVLSLKATAKYGLKVGYENVDLKAQLTRANVLLQEALPWVRECESSHCYCLDDGNDAIRCVCKLTVRITQALKI